MSARFTFLGVCAVDGLFAWGKLVLQKGGCDWSGVNVETLQGVNVNDWVRWKVGEILEGCEEGKDVVLGDALAFKLSTDPRMVFVPSHLNIAVWLLLWEFARKSHSVGLGLFQYAVDGGDIQRRWVVRDRDNKVFTIKLKGLMCECKERSFPTKQANVGGLFVCPHILAVMSKVPLSMLAAHLDELQQDVLGEVVYSFMERDRNDMLGELDMLTRTATDEELKEEVVSFPQPLVEKEERVIDVAFKGEGATIHVVAYRAVGDKMIVQFKWDADSTAEFRISMDTLGQVISKLIHLLLRGENIDTCRHEIVTYIASKDTDIS